MRRIGIYALQGEFHTSPESCGRPVKMPKTPCTIFAQKKKRSRRRIPAQGWDRLICVRPTRSESLRLKFASLQHDKIKNKFGFFWGFKKRLFDYIRVAFVSRYFVLKFSMYKGDVPE